MTLLNIIMYEYEEEDLELDSAQVDTDCHQLPIKGVTVLIADLTTNRYQLNSNLPAFLFLSLNQSQTNIL